MLSRTVYAEVLINGPMARGLSRASIVRHRSLIAATSASHIHLVLLAWRISAISMGLYKSACVHAGHTAEWSGAREAHGCTTPAAGRRVTLPEAHRAGKGGVDELEECNERDRPFEALVFVDHREDGVVDELLASQVEERERPAYRAVVRLEARVARVDDALDHRPVELL